MPTSQLAYLATPYTKYVAGRDAAQEAARNAARLLLSGVTVHAPVPLGHMMAKHGALNPSDLAIWIPFNQATLERCDTLIVAHMDGWLASEGIAHEVMWFAMARRPIFDLDPRTLHMVRRPKADAIAEFDPINGVVLS
jgi:hypothetical protein